MKFSGHKHFAWEPKVNEWLLLAKFSSHCRYCVQSRINLMRFFILIHPVRPCWCLMAGSSSKLAATQLSTAVGFKCSLHQPAICSSPTHIPALFLRLWSVVNAATRIKPALLCKSVIGKRLVWIAVNNYFSTQQLSIDAVTMVFLLFRPWMERTSPGVFSFLFLAVISGVTHLLERDHCVMFLSFSQEDMLAE